MSLGTEEARAAALSLRLCADMSRRIGSWRSRYRRFLGVSLLAAACDSDDPTGPLAGITGVWRGQAPLGSPRDSILLILVDSADGVWASAAWTLDGSRREMLGGGQLAGRQLTLTLSAPSATDLELDLELERGVLVGTMSDPLQARQGAITLRRAPAPAPSLVGQWILTAVRGISLSPGPEYTDTLTLGADGRVRRAVVRRSCRFVANGAHERDGEWVQLEFLTARHMTEGECGYRNTHDSLRVRGSTLTRYTLLFNGGTLEEDFARK